MASFNLYITAKKENEDEIVFREMMNNWHELLNTICPKFTRMSGGFKFDRERILDINEIELLDGILHDKFSVSISEGYEEFIPPVYRDPQIWIRIFRKVKIEYNKSNKEYYVDKINELAKNNELIHRFILELRTAEYHFNQIIRTMEIAKKNNLEIALTISDL